MKTLSHNGILIPEKYHKRGFIVIDKRVYQTVNLSELAEEMLVAWVKKRDTPYVQDPVFIENFWKDFSTEYGKPTKMEDLEFLTIVHCLDEEKELKAQMTKEDKKAGVLQRKALREVNKGIYGYAIVDGHKVELGQYMAEPSSIFMGRARHPMRGKWKSGPCQGDIELNLSPDAPMPEGTWKGRVWESNSLWVARWKDKLNGEMKYTWFSDSYGKKQDREKKKFDKAIELEKNINVVRDHIEKGLQSKDPKRWKVATVSYLIFALVMRVGDEKDPDEADTVGAITLRPEHIKIEGVKIRFDFLGKDSVRWERELVADPQAVKNIESCIKNCKEYLFEGVNSSDVSKFLEEAMPDLTAKVFRTWKASTDVKRFLNAITYAKETPDWLKKMYLKQANLGAAMLLNHKKALPKNFNEVIIKKQAWIDELKKKGKNTAQKEKELDLYKLTSEYNLGTSLRAYVDPRVMKEWGDKNGIDVSQFYTTALKKKFSWVFDGTNT